MSSIEWLTVTTTEPHFGGQRYWFRCPNPDCNHRVRILYAGGRFLCRKCQGLTYATAQSGGALGATLDGRMARIQRRLGGRDNPLFGVPVRPAGMHQRTYIRLAQAYSSMLHVRMRLLTEESQHLLSGLTEDIASTGDGVGSIAMGGKGD